ncbi:sugar ABC transporter substrate-binding protein [Terribacillus sp. 179-K 1B1 HS]|uniref:ABC transporter substrate-binding protein n=1 Tax=Terribacillus sp. 179-K 1B1 HS TaxID=3142388 RepID=UPI0039A0C281
MKKCLFIVTFLVFTLLLSACSASSSSQDEKLQFYVSGDTVEGSALTTMSKKYTEETGVEIEVVDIPYADMGTKITNMIRSKDAPALARVTGFNPVWNGQLLDLSDIAEKNNVNTDLGITVDGELIAPPLDLTAVGMFINTDLFDEAGVPYPTSEEEVWTWDEFINSLETVLEKTDAKYGMVMDGSEHRLNAFLYQHGSNGFYEENGEFTTNDQTKDGIQKFADLNDNRIMPESVWTSGEDAASMFKSGLVAAYMSGSWQITDFSKNITDFAWKSVYMPYEDVRATNLGGNYLVAFDGSGQEEEAKAFIDWLYQKENYEELASLGGYLPVTDDAEIEYEVGEEAYTVYQNEIASSDPVANLQRNEMVKQQLVSKRSASNAIHDEVVKLLNDEIDIDQTLENIKNNFTDANKE